MSKRAVKCAAIVTALILAAATFLSGTIYTMSLPNVSTVYAKSAVITHNDRTEGAFDWEGMRVTAAADWRVVEIFVKEGDFVNEGTELFRAEIDDYEQQKAVLDLALLTARNRLTELDMSSDEKTDTDYIYKRAVEDAAETLSQAEDAMFDSYGHL